MAHNYIYLIQEIHNREAGNNIYKIGRSGDDILNRFGGYKPGKHILFVADCYDQKGTETIIKQEFSKKFQRIVRKRATESFKGDKDDMILLMADICKASIEKHRKRKPQTEKNRWLRIVKNNTEYTLEYNDDKIINIVVLHQISEFFLQLIAFKILIVNSPQTLDDDLLAKINNMKTNITVNNFADTTTFKSNYMTDLLLVGGYIGSVFNQVPHFSANYAWKNFEVCGIVGVEKHYEIIKIFDKYYELEFVKKCCRMN